MKPFEGSTRLSIVLSRDTDGNADRGEQMMQVEVLGNLALVTDKLRQFKIW